MIMNSRYNKYLKPENPKEINEDGYETDKIENIVISYLSLRKSIGFLGIILPILLLIGTLFYNNEILPSISHYYHSSLKIIFTGILISIATFLWSYNGEDSEENHLCTTSAILAILIVIFPTKNDINLLKENQVYYKNDFSLFVPPSSSDITWISGMHFLCAGLFFLCLILMILWKFKGHEKKYGGNKTILIIYNICGYGMILSILGIILAKFIINNNKSCLTFILESIALILFGLAWLIKGETLNKINYLINKK